MPSEQFGDSFDLEFVVRNFFEKQGWNALSMKKNNPIYDIKLSKDNEKGIVQVKNIKTKTSMPSIRKFANYLQDEKNGFTKGFYITVKGFSDSAKAYASEIPELTLGTYDKRTDKVLWHSVPEKMERKYIGVWTCKGGVGKTTVAAHLAGAFAICGYDVMLLDLDPQKNLSKMLGDHVLIRSKLDGDMEHKITVRSSKTWHELDSSEKVIICDCNPNTDSNPAAMIRKFDYCIIPLLLTPLGINKNSAVVNETCAAINKENPHAKIFILINNYMTKDKGKSEKLNNYLRHTLDQTLQDRDKYFYIDPFAHFAIRHHPALKYWGYETIVEGVREQQLGFTTRGNTAPKEDFLQLAEYIQLHTDINNPG